MLECDYEVKQIDGDYAHLQRIDRPEEELKLVARALLPMEIYEGCKAHGIPAVAIVGSMGKGAEDIFEYGIESMITTINGVMTLPDALDHAEELYLGAARRLFRMLRAGRKLSVAVNGVNSNDSHKRAE